MWADTKIYVDGGKGTKNSEFFVCLYKKVTVGVRLFESFL